VDKADFSAKSSLGHNEPAFYILDTVPMLLIALTFVIVWPPRVFESALLEAPSYPFTTRPSQPESK